MDKHQPSFKTHWTFSSDPNAFGTATGSCPAYGRGLGFRPNKPESIKPDAVFMPIDEEIVECPRCGSKLIIHQS